MRVEDKVLEIVTKRAMEKLDIDKLVDKALPEITKSLEKDLLEALKNWDWADMLYDSGIVDEIGNHLLKLMKVKMGIATKKKGK